MLPWIEVEKKSVFSCNLLLLDNVDVEKLYAWLIAKQVTELSFSEAIEGTEKFWVVYFCTEDEQLVIKLQARFKSMALDSLKQKEQNVEKSIQEIESLKGLLQASQSRQLSQAEALQTLEKSYGN